jgi:hypothetical protein
MDKSDREDSEYCSCIWCGQWNTKDAFFKRVERKRDDPNLCKDCTDVRKSNGLQKFKSKRTDHPKLGVLWCYIWSGELNDDWYPIDDNGKLYMPGVRICGFKDCVAEQHVISPKKATVSDIDLILMSMEVRAKHKKVGQNGEKI